jgi:EAL domain-containing protein (putative c-di-GMP-specific phosphodiesterase class I)
MDEPVRVRVAERERGEQRINTQGVAENDLDFSPQCGNAQQLVDSAFGLELELAEALRLRALRMDFQPQFDLGSGRGCGVEALARWVRSTGEVIAPSVFIRIAERAGMIHTLGAWALHSACATASAWCRRAAQPTTLSVNVSALQIDEEFFSVIERTLKQTGFPAKQLELEITESALIANPALSIEHLNAWKQLGVRIAMDDFGTGHSSLSSLSSLPVDRLKLDRSLVHRMTLDKKGAAIMRLVVSLGAELDMEVIAEGVETEEQLQMLTDLGCPQAQGFLLGRPMTAELVQVALGKTWGNRAIPLRSPPGCAVREPQRIDRSAASSKRSTMSSYETTRATIGHRRLILNP